MRHAGVEEAAEPLDEPDDLDLPLAGPRDRAVNGGVEGWSVASGGEDADPLHSGDPYSLGERCRHIAAIALSYSRASLFGVNSSATKWRLNES